MTVAAEHTPPVPPDQTRCGCCERDLPRDRLTELGSTPDVFICANCARWAARRLDGGPRRLGRLAADLTGELTAGISRGGRLLLRRGGRGELLAVKPILPVRDLTRTEAFYARLGLAATLRHPDYLIMNVGDVELHFGREDAPTPTSSYIDARDAGRFWKQLRSAGVEGLGGVEDFDYGMREFVITDPDGNRVRIGSPLPD
jgi:catechol 2,3-dioxygenase-like lactoylglutathione lyase family enzyme